MPIRPEPFELVCSRCQWRKAFRPRSDALMDEPDLVCAKCGCKDLKREPLSTLGSFLVDLKDALNK